MNSTVSRREAGVSVSFALAVVVLVVTIFIYRDALLSYFSDDDFGWLTSESSPFLFVDLLSLERYQHFYRPVIELYFAGGYRLFGCEAWPFHLASLFIHLSSIAALYLFAHALSGQRVFAATASLLFASLPGYVEAVAWVAAITDLLPALWYILTLWLYLRFIQGAGLKYYAAAVVTFTACLLTHESSATLLPLMILVHLVARGIVDRVAMRWLAPLGAALTAILGVSYIVNSRSYLISEGHYRLGGHAVAHILQYIVSLYVGKRGLPSYLAILATVTVLIARGTAPMRLYVAWILLTLLPASFFTWDNVSRYLYIPAAGFSLLLATATGAVRTWLDRVSGPQVGRIVMAMLVAGLTVRFAIFARKESAAFRTRTVPYERFVDAVRSASPSPPQDGLVRLRREDVRLVPEAARDHAAAVAYCVAPVHVVER